ncbi:MAG: thiolase [Chloroflexi bacterium]|nr:thiolase [Chloroflexota bacterium]
MAATTRASIVGAHEHETRFAPEKSALILAAESVERALADAGLGKADVDGILLGGDSMSAIQFAEYLGLHPRFFDSTSVGGSSYEVHVRHAVAALAAGYCEVAVLAYGSNARSLKTPIGTGARLAGGPDPYAVNAGEHFDTPYGVTIIGNYAMVAQRHMHEFGTTREQLAEIAVVTRRHAMLNPSAVLRDPITVEDVINARPVAAPLHLLDCCIITDGAGAIVMTTAERARNCAKAPVWVLGSGEAVVHQDLGYRDLMRMAAHQSAPAAFEEAGIRHADVDFAMIYDSFTITVLLTLEALGFCGRGEGGAFVQGGRIALGGELPINLDGGGLCSNHPGRRGIFLLIEAVRQLRGECGERQVTDARIGICHGTGGLLGARHSGGTVIVGRD